MLSYRWKIGGGVALVLILGVSLLAPAFGVPHTAWAETPSASGLIAFVREGTESGIYTIDQTGSELTRLTDGQDYRPRWSPDGTRIVFQRFETGVRSYIYVMEADGSNLQRLTTRTGFQPAWSPDGFRIVFGSGVGHKAEIFVMNADGSDLIQLTRNRFEDTLPAWSPDGNTIAFTSRRHRNTDVYLMAPDGSDQRRLTRSGAKDSNPDWSPDGVVWSSRAIAEIDTGTCTRSCPTARVWSRSPAVQPRSRHRLGHQTDRGSPSLSPGIPVTGRTSPLCT